MKISPSGLSLIREFEGCRLEAYKDIVGVPTIGYGHTGPEVHKGMMITPDEADELLANDLARFEECVTEMVYADINQNQADALISFAYNLGCEALRSSTLLRLLNAGNARAAADQFGKWVKAGGKVSDGLVRRRAAERELFLRGSS